MATSKIKRKITVNGGMTLGHFFLIVSVFIGTLLIWEVACRYSDLPTLRSAAPISSLSALVKMIWQGNIFLHIGASIARVLVGFAIAGIIGVTLGFVFSFNPRLGSAFNPIFELVRPIPPIAWIPIAIAIFNIGNKSAIFVIFIGCFFPIFTNTMLGVKELNHDMIDAAKTLGASKFRTFRYVIWPSSLPHLLTGVKVGIGFGWMCVVAAEMMGAQSGLGYFIQINRQLLFGDRVVACMIVIGAIGFLMISCVSLLERLLLPWESTATVKDSSSSIHPLTPLDFSNQETLQSILSEIDTKPQTKNVLIENLGFSYPDGTKVLSHINLEVKAGEIFCILGKSGCGKTTFLKILAGLYKTYSGNVSIKQTVIHTDFSHITMLFQSLALFPWMNAKNNVAFPMRNNGLSQKDALKIAERLLKVVDLQEKVNEYPSSLSGGQNQRVALMRALASMPELLLMDEPFSALDSSTRDEIRFEFIKLLEVVKPTVILVTHDIEEAIMLSDRIVVMKNDGEKLSDIITVPFCKPRNVSLRESGKFIQLRGKLSKMLN